MQLDGVNSAQCSRMVSTQLHDPSSSTDRSRDTAGDEATITPRSATVIPAGKDSIEQPALTAHSYDRAWRLARRGSTTGGL